MLLSLDEIWPTLLFPWGMRPSLPSSFPAWPPPPNRTLPAGEFVARTYSNEVGTLGYKLYVPSSYCGQALPLLVMLHGCSQGADDFASGTGMNALAEERQWIIAYPEQSVRAHGAKCWNWFDESNQQRDSGEPALIAGITCAVIEEYAVDPCQVFVAGLSSGGAMAVIMGQTYPDLFTAIGSHSGLPFKSATDATSAMALMRTGVGADTQGSTTKRIPIIVFHGDRDTTVHPSNGAEIIAQSTGAGAQHRSSANKEIHIDVSKGENTGRAYTHEIHRDAGGQTIAEQWTVHGAGHAWSGGTNAGSYADSRGPDAGSEMMRFFGACAAQPA